MSLLNIIYLIKVNALLKQYLYQTVLQPFLLVFPYPLIHILFHNLRRMICGSTVQPAQKCPGSQSFRKSKIFLKKSRRPGGRNHAICQGQNLLVRGEFFHKIGSILLQEHNTAQRMGSGGGNAGRTEGHGKEHPAKSPFPKGCGKCRKKEASFTISSLL